MIEGASSLSERDAAQRFRFDERLQRYGYGGRVPSDGALVSVVEGDRLVEGDLDLDQLDCCGLVIDGNLHVEGTVLLTWHLGGPFLLVTGNLRARNVVAGDGEIRVDGDADVDGLLLGIGTDGHLSIAGTTRAALVMSDGHSMHITTPSPYWRSWECAGMPLAEHLHRDVDDPDAEALVARIRAGQPVVRDADDPRPRKTYAEWLADCAEDGNALANVPPELLTPELCDAALADHPYVLELVPEEWRTAERCRAAVERDGDLLRSVPVPLRTRELCELALETDQSIHAARSIPDEVWTPELAGHAVRLYAGSLRHVPERLRSRELCAAALGVNPFLIDEVPEALREELRKRYVRNRRVRRALLRRD